MKKPSILIATLIVLLASAELFLRIMGFDDIPTYISDPNFEYIHSPNQVRKVYGNNFRTNSFSQRSEEPDSTKETILLIGDSVINGGNQTDQDSLASTKLDAMMGDSVQVLNISAGSWGPANSSYYLEKFGTFGAKTIILVVSSHDAFDHVTHTPVVGNHPNYPARTFNWGISGLLYKVFTPVPKSPPEDTSFTRAFTYYAALSHDVKLIVYLHPTRKEVDKGGFGHGGQRIIKWAEKWNIDLIDGVDRFVGLHEYRDDIHLTDHGQAELADNLRRFLSRTR